MVSKPTFIGGLGFGMKWMMGWMHDTLEYFAKDSIYRKYHQNEITFSLAYAFTENFMLPLSHDEVVYGKKSILGRMPGDEWQRFANLRLLYGYMFTHPGTKLLFMGGEFGQSNEWDFEGSLDWNLLEFKSHKNLQNYFKSLNTFYKTTPALFEKAFSGEGFEWISYDDYQNSVISYIRKGYKHENDVVVVCNLTPKVHEKYRIGIPSKGKLSEVFNSDAVEFGGSGVSNKKPITIKKQPWNGKDYSAELILPPLGICVFNIKP
jgi:1,4-alpha-glucan branching enzyme